MTGTLLPHVTHRLWRCLSLLFSLSKMLRMPCRLQPQHRTAAGTARLLEPGASSQRKLAKWCTGMLVRLGEGTTPRRACLDEQRHDLQWPLAHAPLSNTLQALHQPVVLPPCWAAALIPLPIPLWTEIFDETANLSAPCASWVCWKRLQQKASTAAGVTVLASGGIN